ncbi:Hypothetical protein CINCED_3A004301 [Cinara cedri]|uniref:Uncharacterized protein n=1 Tax=Cinara cedri TaxID=506608 RepID=A0A5E4MIC3_9HEMI|nr:Hypothetical protein CINCED_3A004301 [Cinara cedri]
MESMKELLKSKRNVNLNKRDEKLLVELLCLKNVMTLQILLTLLLNKIWILYTNDPEPPIQSTTVYIVAASILIDKQLTLLIDKVASTS